VARRMTASLEGQINSILQGEDGSYAEEPLVCWGWGRVIATNAAKHIQRKARRNRFHTPKTQRWKCNGGGMQLSRSGQACRRRGRFTCGYAVITHRVSCRLRCSSQNRTASPTPNRCEGRRDSGEELLMAILPEYLVDFYRFLVRRFRT